MGSPDGTERREWPRFPVKMAVELRHLGRPDESVEDLARNLSAGGVFVETSVVFEPGTAVEVEVRGRGNTEVALKALVVRVESEPSEIGSTRRNPVRGMALRFFEASPEQIEELTQLGKSDHTADLDVMVVASEDVSINV